MNKTKEDKISEFQKRYESYVQEMVNNGFTRQQAEYLVSQFARFITI